ncbi:MAG: hypothetical protein AAF636_02265 [Pseudomonadota bacterium]
MYPEDFYATVPVYLTKVRTGIVDEFEKRRFACVVLFAILSVGSFLVLFDDAVFSLSFRTVSDYVANLLLSLV